jgi:diguanylate cyclase (GGDEF)-like protein
MATEHQLSEVLSEFARTMVTDFPIQSILDHLVRRIVEILPVTGAGVTLISPTTSPRYIAASDSAALRYEKLQTELSEGPCLVAYDTGEAVAVPDLREDDRFERFTPRALGAGLMAVFTFPLRQGDSRLGALDLYRDTPGPLDLDDLASAQTLADVTAAYLVNAQARADLETSSAQSHQDSLHDALTGLPNRVLLLEHFGHALKRNRRSGKTVAVLYVDLDEFKAVNDAHGHSTGDQVLIAVAQRMADLLRAGDTLARMSGDEFVILCEDLDEEQAAQDIASRVVHALSEVFNVADVEVHISASVGVAFGGSQAIPLSEPFAEMVLQLADEAMYQAKCTGRRVAGRKVAAALTSHHARWRAATAEILFSHLSEEPLGVSLALICKWTADLSGAESATLMVREDQEARVIASEGSSRDRLAVGHVGELTPIMAGALASGAPRGGPTGGSGGYAKAFPVSLPTDNTSRARSGALVIFGPDSVHLGREQEEVLSSLATQAALAFELAYIRSGRDQLLLSDDRERIVRDLHDLVTQRLFDAGLRLQGVLQLIDNPVATETVASTVCDLDATIEEIREVIFALKAARYVGLEARVSGEVADAAERLGFTPASSFRAVPGPELDVHLQLEMVAVLREALSNAARHAYATRVNVRVSVDRELRVVVADDGTGIGEHERLSGIAKARARAEGLGGSLDISPATGGGTYFDWRVPLSCEPAT